MQTKKKVLIIDDDIEILQLLEEIMQQYGFDVSIGKSGAELKNLLSQDSYDILLLDVMLPDSDGISLCQEIRKNSNILIILLTANTNESDRVLGLELGADDYIQKPFNPRELLARIKALFRRYDQPDNTELTQSTLKKTSYQFCGWKLNTATHQLFSPDETEISITSAGYELLLAFVEHPQRVLSRDFLLDLTKNRSIEPFDRSIDILVSRLRQKFENDSNNPQLIKTIRNGGYMFTQKVELV